MIPFFGELSQARDPRPNAIRYTAEQPPSLCQEGVAWTFVLNKFLTVRRHNVLDNPFLLTPQCSQSIFNTVDKLHILPMILQAEIWKEQGIIKCLRQHSAKEQGILGHFSAKTLALHSVSSQQSSLPFSDFTQNPSLPPRERKTQNKERSTVTS